MSQGIFENLEGKDPYIRIVLYLNTKQYHVSLHVLILKSFLPDGRNEFEMTNHKDGDRRNPKLFNQEPSNSSLNPIHAQRVLGKNRFVEVKRILISNDNNEKEEVTYACIADAWRENNLNHTTLCRYINEGKEVSINGKLYLFTRENPIQERQYLDITWEQFQQEFKEIKGIITIQQPDGNLCYPEYEGYYISRLTGMIVTIEGNKFAILQSYLNSQGYSKVILYGTKNSKGYHNFYVSRLVLFVFSKYNCVIENGKIIPYWLLVADHIDHEITNNSESNLQWITQQQNRIRSIEYNRIRVSNSYYKTSTVLPACKVLSYFCGLSEETHIYAAINNKTIFWGNKIEYITKEEYDQEKANNTSMYLFSDERSKMVKQYDLHTRKLIQTFDAQDNASLSLRLDRTTFGKAVKYKCAEQTPQVYWDYDSNIDYSDSNNVETHLTFYEMIYHESFWKIINGTFNIIDLKLIKEEIGKIERYYIKMRENPLE